MNHDLAVEVKSFRYRTEDWSDDISLRKAGQSGVLVLYGNSAEIQTQVEDAISRKVEKYSGPEILFLYFWSRSPHHVEDVEIECAVRTIFYDERHSDLIGLFYKSNGRTFLAYPARNQSTCIELFGGSFSSKVM